MHSKLISEMEKSTDNIKGKICIVTGANSGIGKETTRALAGMGATVVMVVRNQDASEKVRQEIINETGNKSIELMIADLFSMNEVRKLASDFKKTHTRLDVLINNAGGIFPKREVTVDGFERTFALNLLAPFLLTHELLDILRVSAPSRIINVSSAAHLRGKVDFENLQSEKKFGQMGPYSNAKLMNIMFTYALARRLNGTNITVNALHPGVVRTRFGQNDASRARKLAFRMLGPFFKSPEKGAKTSIYLATSPEVEGISGKYFVNCSQKESLKISYDDELQEKLWKHIESLLAIA
jgi:NAD(P)-dependent dehydrogenase (short-subunit alcohol dehydrogenase family)